MTFNAFQCFSVAHQGSLPSEDVDGISMRGGHKAEALRRDAAAWVPRVLRRVETHLKRAELHVPLSPSVGSGIIDLNIHQRGGVAIAVLRLSTSVE